MLQMGSHSDWAMSTTFSLKGDHVISGGRDMSVKLTEVASNVLWTMSLRSHPVRSRAVCWRVATHPQFEHMVTGGSDGLPKVYRIFREVKREIGDDAQFIADLFPMNWTCFQRAIQRRWQTHRLRQRPGSRRRIARLQLRLHQRCPQGSCAT